jgi:flagellar biosynthesis protein FliR
MSPHSLPTKKRHGMLASLRSVQDVLGSLKDNKMLIALPLVVVLLLLAAILGVLALVPAISPFVYPLL